MYVSSLNVSELSCEGAGILYDEEILEIFFSCYIISIFEQFRKLIQCQARKETLKILMI